MASSARQLKKLDWRRRLQDSEKTTRKPFTDCPMDKGKVVVPNTGKKERQPKVTADTITLEGLNDNVCRQLWLEAQSLDDILVKTQLGRARVHWAIQMPIFAIRDFEPCLRMMIKSYNDELRSFSFKYQHTDVTVSFAPDDFARVFGIPDEGKKVDKQAMKISAERKNQLLQQICRDNLTRAEWDRITAPKGRGLKKSYIVLGAWQ